MHKSRLGAIVIDCQTDDLDRETAFWSAALGYGAESAADAKESNYRALQGPPGEIGVLLQQVDHPSRVHLDIETDDQEAEVARLEGLGARRIAWIKRWCVMEAPGGHRFCVVGPQRDDFAEKARIWK